MISKIFVLWLNFINLISSGRSIKSNEIGRNLKLVNTSIFFVLNMSISMVWSRIFTTLSKWCAGSIKYHSDAYHVPNRNICTMTLSPNSCVIAHHNKCVELIGFSTTTVLHLNKLVDVVVIIIGKCQLIHCIHFEYDRTLAFAFCKKKNIDFMFMLIPVVNKLILSLSSLVCLVLFICRKPDRDKKKFTRATA